MSAGSPMHGLPLEWALPSPAGAADFGEGPQIRVKNTFLECLETVGELLAGSEREEALAARRGGLRRAATWAGSLTTLALGDCRQRTTCPVVDAPLQAAAAWLSTPSSECSTMDTVGRQSASEGSECRDAADGGTSFALRRGGPGHTVLPVAVAQPALGVKKPDLKDTTVAAEVVPSRRGQLFPVGASGFPSVGSAGHERRECKPCAFLDSRKGCIAAQDCAYCHLCDQGEKKRRQKERRKLHSGTQRPRRTAQADCLP